MGKTEAPEGVSGSRRLLHESLCGPDSLRTAIGPSPAWQSRSHQHGQLLLKSIRRTEACVSRPAHSGRKPESVLSYMDPSALQGCVHGRVAESHRNPPDGVGTKETDGFIRSVHVHTWVSGVGGSRPAPCIWRPPSLPVLWARFYLFTGALGGRRAEEVGTETQVRVSMPAVSPVLFLIPLHVHFLLGEGPFFFN